MESRVVDKVEPKALTKLSAEAKKMAPNEVSMPEAATAASTQCPCLRPTGWPPRKCPDRA